MINVTVGQIAEIVGGHAFGNAEQLVTGVAVVDSRRALAGDLFIAMRGASVDGHDHVESALMRGASAVIAQREVPGSGVVVADPMLAVADLARWSLKQIRERGDITVVALTGSQGKTSVKDLAAHIFEAHGATVAAEGSFNNELGVPLTVLRADLDTQWLVLEMGARGIGHIEYLCSIARPDVAVVLNVGTAHVGEFGSVEAIGRAKSEIISALRPSGIAVLNSDDRVVADMAEKHEGRTVTFGHGGDVHVRGPVTLTRAGHAQMVLDFNGRSFPVTVPQVGYHHGINASAAGAIGIACGLQPENIVVALATAAPRSQMRMEVVRTNSGILVLNDAYNANPESMRAALDTLVGVATGRTIAVLGPMLELGADSDEHHRTIGQHARDLGVDRVIVVGETARPIADGAGERAEFCETMAVAIDTLLASLCLGDTVLVKASRSIAMENVVVALRVA